MSYHTKLLELPLSENIAGKCQKTSEHHDMLCIIEYLLCTLKSIHTTEKYISHL